MCTLSIHHSAQEILVTMNRDEMLTRAPETPPAQFETAEGVTCVAPRDGERGGTWMGANDHGVVACLLNFYMPGESLMPDTTGRYSSRGEIIPQALAQGSGDAVLSWLLEEFDPTQYPSFDLHVITPDCVRRIMWMKKSPLRLVENEEEWSVFSSSGWDSDDITTWREEKFCHWLSDGAEMNGNLPKFHLLQEANHEDRSPLMKRDWSATRSVTQVHWPRDASSLSMRYWPDPQPETIDPHTLCTLALSPSVTRGVQAKAP